MSQVHKHPTIGASAEAAARSVRQFFDALTDRLEPQILAALPEGVSVSVSVTGDEGGEWTVQRTEDRVLVAQGIARDNDCFMTCTVADFQALLRGELSGVSGFLSGQLRVEGDVGLALALQHVIAPSESA